jgi:hypothetical protein
LAKDIIYFHEGNEKGSIEYTKDFQEGTKENSGFQVGKEDMRLHESLRNSEESSNQKGVFKEEGEKPH